MKIITIIPARMNSSRFYGKPLKKINGIPMIQRVYDNVKNCKKIESTYVATCDKEIYNFIKSINGNVIMTSKKHKRATERTSEALSKIEKKNKKKYDIVVMVQGDEPMITASMINQSISPFMKHKDIKVVNLMTKIKNLKEFEDLNEPKVVFDQFNNALYFSRSPIPSPWLKFQKNIYKQVCAIPFERSFLLKFNKMKSTLLEETESIDMNRILESGIKIKMVEIKKYVKSVDNIADLKEVEKMLYLNKKK